MKKNWINKIIEVNGVKYIISSTDKISFGDLIAKGGTIKKYDDTHSLMGWYKVIATEEEIGFVQLESRVRLFEVSEKPEIEYVPFTKRWMDAILNRNGICSIEGVFENKLVVNF
jgi:hypothetical protein